MHGVSAFGIDHGVDSELVNKAWKDRDHKTGLKIGAATGVGTGIGTALLAVPKFKAARKTVAEAGKAAGATAAQLKPARNYIAVRQGTHAASSVAGDAALLGGVGGLVGTKRKKK